MKIDYIEALRPLFDCMTDGVCIAEADGRLIYANDAAGRLLGPAAEEAVRNAVCGPLCGGIEGAACGKDAAECPLKVARGPEDSVSFEGRHAASGRDLRIRCLRVRLPSSERHFVLIEDATAAAALRRQKEDWRQMLAHDLRSPLSIAMGALRYLEDLDEAHAFTAEDKQLITNGARSCLRIEALIESFLATERLIDGSTPVRLASVDADVMIAETVQEHAGLARERRLSLTGAAPKGALARADPDLLRRALANLIGNALKFTPPGGRVEVSASRDRAEVRIQVADDGPGISTRDLPRVFDRYYQGEDGPRRRGLGLGLAFCRTALRAMGGEASVRSLEGRGSVFTLRVPAEGGGP